MLLQHNKMDLENNQEMEQENAVKLSWINLPHGVQESQRWLCCSMLPVK